MLNRRWFAFFFSFCFAIWWWWKQPGFQPESTLIGLILLFIVAHHGSFSSVFFTLGYTHKMGDPQLMLLLPLLLMGVASSSITTKETRGNKSSETLLLSLAVYRYGFHVVPYPMVSILYYLVFSLSRSLSILYLLLLLFSSIHRLFLFMFCATRLKTCRLLQKNCEHHIYMFHWSSFLTSHVCSIQKRQ